MQLVQVALMVARILVLAFEDEVTCPFPLEGTTKADVMKMVEALQWYTSLWRNNTN
jgi:hypothetical protein